MKSQGWGFDLLDRPPRKLALRADPPRLVVFVPVSANVRKTTKQYCQTSLLGLPQEIRWQIWDYILNDIEYERSVLWHAKPQTPYDSLLLVSTQVYHEAEDYLRRSIVPSNRVTKFLTQPYTESKLQSFKSLSIELPFNMDLGFFLDMASALNTLAPILEHLQIFFTGCDAYNTRTHLHGCGNRITTATSRDRKLPQDGQGFQERHVLINVLSLLTNLKTMVLSNLNLPILQQHIMKHKPKLKKLYVLSDPRSTLHIPWKTRHCGTGLLLPVTENFPPVKELVLSANSVIGSIQVPGKLSPSLEKLTWVVPNAARQSGSMIRDWHDETGILLLNLRSNAKKLHTLRICFEGSTYEGHESYGSLIGSFKLHMPHLTSLKRFELHFWSKSSYIAREFIQALPRSLERFYISDRFAPALEVFNRTKEVYFPDAEESEVHAIDRVDDHKRWHPGNALGSLRKDFIQLVGDLGFVGYEYDGMYSGRWMMTEVQDDRDRHGDDHQGIQDDDAAMSLLWLNGRLLDRERNKHLGNLVATGLIAGGKSTPPRLYAAKGQTIVTAAKDREQLLKFVAVAQTPDQEEDTLSQSKPKSAISDAVLHRLRNIALGINTEFHFNNKSYDQYFGNEDEAEKVFKAERVAKVADLPPRKFPIVIPCPSGYEDHEHWMCV